MEPPDGRHLDRLLGIVLLAEAVCVAALVGVPEVLLMRWIEIDAEVLHRREGAVRQDQGGIRLRTRRIHGETALPVGELRIRSIRVQARHAGCECPHEYQPAKGRRHHGDGVWSPEHHVLRGAGRHLPAVLSMP